VSRAVGQGVAGAPQGRGVPQGSKRSGERIKQGTKGIELELREERGCNGGEQGEALHKRSESNPTRLKKRQREGNRVHGHATGAHSGVNIDRRGVTAGGRQSSGERGIE
jgi:hypothetical protein